MTDKKWTPGPWALAIGKTYCAIRNGQGVIADMRIAGCYYNIFDANLMAAAPDLYDALLELAEWYTEHTGLPASKANYALAKARGEKQ